MTAQRIVVAMLVGEIHAAIVGKKEDERVVPHVLGLQRFGQIPNGLVHRSHHRVEDAPIHVGHGRVQIFCGHGSRERG